MMEPENSNISVETLWTDSEVKKLLCPSCFSLAYPPMQLLCCGLRICENCLKRYYYYLIQLNKVDKQIFFFQI